MGFYGPSAGYTARLRIGLENLFGKSLARSRAFRTARGALEAISTRFSFPMKGQEVAGFPIP